MGGRCGALAAARCTACCRAGRVPAGFDRAGRFRRRFCGYGGRRGGRCCAFRRSGVGVGGPGPCAASAAPRSSGGGGGRLAADGRFCRLCGFPGSRGSSLPAADSGAAAGGCCGLLCWCPGGAGFAGRFRSGGGRSGFPAVGGRRRGFSGPGDAFGPGGRVGSGIRRRCRRGCGVFARGLAGGTSGGGFSPGTGGGRAPHCGRFLRRLICGGLCGGRRGIVLCGHGNPFVRGGGRRENSAGMRAFRGGDAPRSAAGARKGEMHG